MERGITTLVQQGQLITLLSLSNRTSRNPDNTGAGEVGASSVDTPRQEEEELEGGFYDYEDEEIRQEERSVICRTSPDDVEKAIASMP